MKIITDLIDNMEQEIDLAKIYAQNYLIYSADKNREWAERFKIMAKESLIHSDNIHALAVETINKLSESYTPPAEMMRVWSRAHTRYIDTVNWIKDMVK